MQCFRASVFGRSFVHPSTVSRPVGPYATRSSTRPPAPRVVPVSGGGPPCLIDLTTRATSRQLDSIQHPTSRRSGRGPAHLYKSASVRSLCRCEHAFAAVEDLSFHRELTSTNIATTLSSTRYNHRGTSSSLASPTTTVLLTKALATSRRLRRAPPRSAAPRHYHGLHTWRVTTRQLAACVACVCFDLAPN